MIKKAYIYSQKKCDMSRKLCGLFVLERMIYILDKAGIHSIHVMLDDGDKDFYNEKIAPHIKKRNIAAVVCSPDSKVDKGSLLLPCNLFMQVHYFDQFDVYFIKRNSVYEPVLNDEQFIVDSNNDIKMAETLVVNHIKENTGGYIARNINKSVSIPISLQLAKTRIHPNILTIVNMLIGVMSAYYVLQGTYWQMVMGGFLFQMASVFDGVDGEVAKFTFKVSKIGGWLDTIGDNGTLLLFLTAVSILYFKSTTFMIGSIVIAFLFMGLFWFIGMVVWYLRKYSNSGSLVAYDKEFLQKLPGDDIFVRLAMSVKYFIKKEFFSLFFFCISLTGAIHVLIPMISFIVCAAAAVITIINMKYFKLIKTLSPQK